MGVLEVHQSEEFQDYIKNQSKNKWVRLSLIIPYI